MKTSIRDVLRRERWDANRKAHEMDLVVRDAEFRLASSAEPVKGWELLLDAWLREDWTEYVDRAANFLSGARGSAATRT